MSSPIAVPVKWLAYLGILPAILIAGPTALVPLGLLLENEESRSPGSIIITLIVLAGSLLWATLAGACIQIARRRYWAESDEMHQNRRRAKRWIPVFAITYLLGIPLVAAGGIGVLVMIASMLLLGNVLAAYATGLPCR